MHAKTYKHSEEKIFVEGKQWEEGKKYYLSSFLFPFFFFRSCLLHELTNKPKDILRQEKYQFLSNLFSSLL